MRYERVKITRDNHTVYNRAVFPWEVPILEFTFGEGNVVRQEGAFESNDLPYPEPAREFERLQLAYGSDPQSGVPYAASVYGQASAGVNHLRRAMEEAKASERAAFAKPARKPARSRRVDANDPLLV